MNNRSMIILYCLYLTVVAYILVINYNKQLWQSLTKYCLKNSILNQQNQGNVY